MQKGGKHEIFGTHNNLLGLKDGLYLEAISIDPSSNKINYPRWFNLDNFHGPPKLTNWICNCEKIEEIVMNTSVDVGKVKKITRPTNRSPIRKKDLVLMVLMDLNL